MRENRSETVRGMSYNADTPQAVKTGIRGVSTPADSFGPSASKQRTFIKAAQNLKNSRSFFTGHFPETTCDESWSMCP